MVFLYLRINSWLIVLVSVIIDPIAGSWGTSGLGSICPSICPHPADTTLHHLHIIHFRINKAIEERLCLICNNGTVEDEEHFLFHCNFYYAEHQDFYNYMKNNIPNFNNLSIEQTLQTVMTKDYVQIFSKYLWKIYQMRQKKLFV